MHDTRPFLILSHEWPHKLAFLGVCRRNSLYTTKSVKGFEKTSKLLKKESWLSALEELVSFYLIYIISRGGDYSIVLVSKSSLICSHVFFKTRQLKKTKFKITSNIIYTNHFTMIYQILFYLEKLVKTFWLFGDTGASTTKMDECFWFDDFFSKAKEFFQQLWQSAWFRNARQVPFIHQLVIANTFQALVREELVKWPVFRGQNFQPFIHSLYVRIWELPFFH